MTRDLMFKDEIQRLVCDAYGALEEPAGSALRHYTDEQLSSLPASAVRWALGVGNPVAHADLAAGEVVVDLGSGGGIDTLLAAAAVGPSGRAVGIDILPVMVERARRSAAEAGVDNAVFVEAELEDLPLTASSADVVISNGTLNLCARKSRVLAEAFAALRPGGRLVVADLTIREEQLPSEVLTHPSAWAG